MSMIRPSIGVLGQHGDTTDRMSSMSDRAENLDFKLSEFVGANSITSAHITAEYLIGAVPSEKECIIKRVVYKANHNCEWVRRRIYLTSTCLLFSFETEDRIRDKIVLHEVRGPFDGMRTPP